MADEIKELRDKVGRINEIMRRIELNARLERELDEHTEICAVDGRGAEINIEPYSNDLFNNLLELVPEQLEADIKLLKETIK